MITYLLVLVCPVKECGHAELAGGASPNGRNCPGHNMPLVLRRYDIKETHAGR